MTCPKPSDEVAFGSGNVFADIGIPNPWEHLLKADLAIMIGDVLDERGLTPDETTDLTGVPFSDISAMTTNGQFGDVSTYELCRILNALGMSVSLVASREPDRRTGTTRAMRGRDIVEEPHGDGEA